MDSFVFLLLLLLLLLLSYEAVEGLSLRVDNFFRHYTYTLSADDEFSKTVLADHRESYETVVKHGRHPKAGAAI